jgi:hypothetical protein
VLEVQLLTGHHAGEKVFIHRIYNQPSDDQNAFKFTRKQFPVQLCFSMTINMLVYGARIKGEKDNQLDSGAIKPPGFVQYISQRRLIITNT